MRLEGSCHCGAVRFEVESLHPYPFNLCYCTVCRKTAGAGGFAINLGADFRTLQVTGREHIQVYRAQIQNPEDETPRQSRLERSFCRDCGSALWCWHPNWPELVHPHASAIDTSLPLPPERTHMMLDFRAPWVVVPAGPKDGQHGRYPDETIAEWHERLKLVTTTQEPPSPSRAENESATWYADEAFWRFNESWMFDEKRFEQAVEQIDAILERVTLEPGAPVLDLCCGPGRHSLELARRGFAVTAVDRTRRYLDRARAAASEAGLHIRFVESDMRDYRERDAFGLALSLFTSFGYFVDPEDDRRVLLNLAESLRPGGVLVLELMGKEILARIFAARDWSEKDGALHLEERTVGDAWGWIDNRWIVIDGNEHREFRFGHRLYSGVELRTLLASCGFRDVVVAGDLSGSAYDHAAKRLVVFATR